MCSLGILVKLSLEPYHQITLEENPLKPIARAWPTKRRRRSDCRCSNYLLELVSTVDQPRNKYAAVNHTQLQEWLPILQRAFRCIYVPLKLQTCVETVLNAPAWVPCQHLRHADVSCQADSIQMSAELRRQCERIREPIHPLSFGL